MMSPKSIRLLRNHVADRLGAQESFEPGYERPMDCCRPIAGKLSPVIDDLGIGHGARNLSRKLVSRGTTHVGERPALAAFQKGEDRIGEDRMHLVAPTARQPFENRGKVGGKESLFQFGMSRKDIEADGNSSSDGSSKTTSSMRSAGMIPRICSMRSPCGSSTASPSPFSMSCRMRL